MAPSEPWSKRPQDPGLPGRPVTGMGEPDGAGAALLSGVSRHREALPVTFDPCMIATAPAGRYPGRNPGDKSWIRSASSVA